LAEVLLLVFVSILIAVYLDAITDALARRLKVPRWAGLLCAVGGSAAVLIGAGFLILPPIIDQTQALVSALPENLGAAQRAVARLSSLYPLLRNSRLSDPNSGIVAELITDATNFLRGSLLPYLRAGGGLVIEAFSVIVMGLYLARNPALYREGIVSLAAPRYRRAAAAILQDLGETLKAWVVGQLLDMLVLMVLVALGLLLLGTPYWLAFGAMAGIAAIVPFFGTLVSTILPALFVVGSGDWLKATLVLLLGVVVHLIEANLVNPLVMERKVSLPPVLTIASVLAAGTLFGLIGLVVAVPILAVTMVVLKHVLHGLVYGDPDTVVGPAVLRQSERRRGLDRRITSDVAT
jgi:predicted PurR-regulated permease PerM